MHRDISSGNIIINDIDENDEASKFTPVDIIGKYNRCGSDEAVV